MNTAAVVPASEILLRRLDVSGLRYSSYPTSDRFVEAFSAQDYAQALALRCVGAAAKTQPLSLYVHIPFCESLCYFCACNKTITKHHERAKSYLQYLGRELDLHTAYLGVGQVINRLHLGGGTPTFFSDHELRELMEKLRASYAFAIKGAYSIDIDPRTVDASRLTTLAELGFNQLNFGVHDFDPCVQKAVHRAQPFEQVASLFAASRQLGFETVKFDLLYGLPRQSTASFGRTIAQVIELRPDRIALNAYAHMPARFKSQRRIAAADLPSNADMATMLTNSTGALLAAGYVCLGLDQFALPGDLLAIAKRQGRLQRNFQGYCSQREGDHIGLGVSSLGRMGATYSQNTQSLDEYFNYLDHGLFPVVRGLGLSRDDLVRRAVIMSLICQGEVLFESIELAHLLVFENYFATEMQALGAFAEQGLLTLDRSGIQVTSAGFFVAGTIAAVFDRYLQADRTRARFSKII